MPSDAINPTRGGFVRTPPPRRLVKRHSLLVRITHWVNVVCLVILLMSGLQIFNAHPALYWGNLSDFDHPILAMDSERVADSKPRGVTTLFGHRFDTTGLFGLSSDATGRPWDRGFPAWATLPGEQSLAGGRLWHFFFAWLFVINGLVYIAAGLLNGHFRHDLLPSRQELRGIGHTTREHLLFRFPEGEAARRYNVLQQLAYLSIIALALPLIVLAGLTMSPRLNAAFPWLLTLFDGRQSARTVHFILAWILVAFVLLHVFMVLVSGVWNNLRSMVTGRYAIRDDTDAAR
jgi:thiosulfate reductase cytochrome b subunit